MIALHTEPVPVALLRTLHRRGKLLPLLREAAAEEAAITAARERGLTASPTELQAAADAFRHRRGLTTAADTRAWLAAQGLTPADLEAIAERDVLIDKFQSDLVANGGAERFAADSARYARARLRLLVSASEGEAHERAAQVREDGVDFAELARRYSLDGTTRTAGGDLGEVFRAALPAAVGTAVFAARAGDVVGPFAGDRGFALLAVEALLPPDLTGAVPLLRAELYAEWLRGRATLPDLSWLEVADGSA